MKTKKMILALLITAATWSSCKKDDAAVPELAKPTAQNLEIGTNNNKRGIIGADFHLNADIVAGDKIDNVTVRIAQKTTETYTAAWKFEVSWETYKGAKNTNIHKHFDIPADAPKGKYDFFLIVTDQNGTKLEIKEGFTILAAADLPFNPTFTFRNVPTDNQVYKKGESIIARFSVNNVRDEGTLCAVLIKESAKHYPETVSKIDFSKAITLGNYTDSTTPSWGMFNTLVVGAEVDYAVPAPLPISAAKAWESGRYNLVLIYENKVHNISIHKSIPITINYQ